MEQLGIDPKLLISQIINFLILYFLLNKLLYKPIVKLLEDRKKAVEKTHENLDKSREELEKTEETRKKVLLTADKKAEEIISLGQANGKTQSKEIIDNARIEAQKIIASAKASSDQLMESVLKTVQKRTGKMVIDLTTKMVSDLDDETQHQVLQSMLKKLN